MSGKAVITASIMALLVSAPAVAQERGTMESQQQGMMQATLHFEDNKTDLSDSAKTVLDQKIPVFRANPAMRIVIMPEVCAHNTSDMKMGGDTLQGQAQGDTTGGLPEDTTAEQERLPYDTGGAISREDTGEAKLGEQKTGVAEADRTLDAKRAEETKKYLVGRGVDSNRIEVAFKKMKDHKNTTKEFGRDTVRQDEGEKQGQQPEGQQPPDGQQPDGQQPEGQQPEGQQPVGQEQAGHEQGQWQMSDCPETTKAAGPGQAGQQTGQQQFQLLIASQPAKRNTDKQQQQQQQRQPY
jgi:hypothetical protein